MHTVKGWWIYSLVTLWISKRSVSPSFTVCKSYPISFFLFLFPIPLFPIRVLDHGNPALHRTLHSFTRRVPYFIFLTFFFFFFCSFSSLTLSPRFVPADFLIRYRPDPDANVTIYYNYRFWRRIHVMHSRLCIIIQFMPRRFETCVKMFPIELHSRLESQT